MSRLAFVVFLVGVNAGCLSQVIPAHEPAEEGQMLGILQTQAFHGSGFVQTDPSPFASALAPGAWVTNFVSSDAATAYGAVTPDADHEGAPFPVGGCVVRAVADANGEVTKLTVMVKREPGYFPEAGDFFFGVTDPEGNPMSDGDTLQWGKLQSCAQCHATRSASGFLFGVAMADR